MNFKTIAPAELDRRLKRGDEITLVDVREPVEFEIARIEGADLLPLSRFNEWTNLLNPDEEIVVICHHGIRSAKVCSLLVQQGFEKVYNLVGGIDCWSLEVDAKVPRY